LDSEAAGQAALNQGSLGDSMKNPKQQLLALYKRSLRNAQGQLTRTIYLETHLALDPGQKERLALEKKNREEQVKFYEMLVELEEQAP
jgi:hypothetical protein